MKLIIIRHAEAVAKTPDVSEEWRYLTPEGRVFFRKTARTMVEKGVSPDLILTSPLIRAVQTADILAETLSYDGPLLAVNDLAPGFDITDLENILAEYRSVNELVLVGHEPDLSDLIVSLFSPGSGVKFKKGTAVMVKLEPSGSGTAAFKWLASGKNLVTSWKEAFEQ
ncbi:MAG TPA: phosphohistidine phosphatase SixA [Geobacteraceae bacterium]|nr:phosphohistidine phosphatase SixA [Geobacteraceae bacterium]